MRIQKVSSCDSLRHIFDTENTQGQVRRMLFLWNPTARNVQYVQGLGPSRFLLLLPPPRPPARHQVQRRNLLYPLLCPGLISVFFSPSPNRDHANAVEICQLPVQQVNTREVNWRARKIEQNYCSVQVVCVLLTGQAWNTCFTASNILPILTDPPSPPSPSSDDLLYMHCSLSAPPITSVFAW